MNQNKYKILNELEAPLLTKEEKTRLKELNEIFGTNFTIDAYPEGLTKEQWEKQNKTQNIETVKNPILKEFIRKLKLKEEYEPTLIEGLNNQITQLKREITIKQKQIRTLKTRIERIRATYE
jgi:uncharacterized coiled-coil protein SlyX